MQLHDWQPYCYDDRLISFPPSLVVRLCPCKAPSSPAIQSAHAACLPPSCPAVHVSAACATRAACAARAAAHVSTTRATAHVSTARAIIPATHATTHAAEQLPCVDGPTDGKQLPNRLHASESDAHLRHLSLPRSQLVHSSRCACSCLTDSAASPASPAFAHSIPLVAMVSYSTSTSLCASLFVA